MMQLFLEALDVWLFRDGRPFDAFSDHRAESIFPPYPTVVQGAIRSHHLVVKGINLRDRDAIKKTVGAVEDYGDLRIRGPFLAQREGGHIVRYLPQPANAVSADRASHKLRPAARPVAPPPTTLTSAPTPYLLGLRDEPGKGETGLWLRHQDLFSYLDRHQEVTGVKANQLFQRESRFGIGRDDARRTTLEGALFEVEFIRPLQDVGLYLEVEGYHGWPESGLMRIGGEGRAARFEQLASGPAWPAAPDPLPQHFKVYFATPTYFEGGWRPENWGKFFAGQVELKAAALNRYESLGGYDWAKDPKDARAHKPARRYVPAGAVYYFESDGQTSLQPGLIQNAITDLGAEIGFGQIIVGRW